MNNEATLFDAPVARATDPATSHKAAASVVEITEKRQAVLDVLADGSFTDEEIYPLLKVKMSTSGARTRRSELCKAGLVIDSGETRLTAAGRQTIVWRLA